MSCFYRPLHKVTFSLSNRNAFIEALASFFFLILQTCSHLFQEGVNKIKTSFLIGY